MTQQELQDVMKFHLSNFNDEGVEIDDNTIHDTVLSDSDGFGAATSKNIYRAVIRWTMQRNNHEDKPWPSTWFEKDVEFLASKII